MLWDLRVESKVHSIIPWQGCLVNCWHLVWEMQITKKTPTFMDLPRKTPFHGTFPILSNCLWFELALTNSLPAQSLLDEPVYPVGSLFGGREPLHGEHACFIGSLCLHWIYRFDSVAHFEECSPGVTVAKYANTIFVLVGLSGLYWNFEDSKKMLHFPLHKWSFERIFFWKFWHV